MQPSCAYCEKTLGSVKIICEKCENIYYCSTFHKSIDWNRHKMRCGEEGYARIVPSSQSKQQTFDDDSDSKMVIEKDEVPYIVHNRFKPNKFTAMFDSIIQRNGLLNLKINKTPEDLLELGSYIGKLINPATNRLFTSLELFALSNEWKIYKMMYESDQTWDAYLEKQKEFVQKNK